MQTRLTVFLMGALGLALVSACSSPAPTPSPTGPGGVPPLTQPTTTGPTVGQLAAGGQTVFSNSCRCHGDKGQGGRGPAIIGADSKLGKYNTAQGLFDYLRAAMPMNAPGSLTQPQYTEVLGFLLVQNNLAPPESAFNQDQMKNIPLK